MSLKTARRVSGRLIAQNSWSLAARLTAWYGASAFAVVLVATWFLYWALVRNLDRKDDRFLADKIRIVRGFLRNQPDDVAALRDEVQIEWADTDYAPIYVRISYVTRGLLIETQGMSDLLPASTFAPIQLSFEELPQGTDVGSADGRLFRASAAHGAVGSPAREDALIYMALDRQASTAVLAGYRRELWTVLSVALVTCALIGHRIAQGGIRPIREISETAGRVRSTSLNERIQTGGLPAELLTLAETFNGMLDRLEESFGRLTQFSAAIAHELRTPLNNLRGEAEVALGRSRSPQEYRDVLGSCLEECSQLTRIIDSLLFLARAENPANEITRERIDVEREIGLLREFYEPMAIQNGVTLTSDCEPNVCANVDRTLFQRAVSNLISNALAHTPSGGTVQIAAAQRAATVCIQVSDTGCGIPDSHLPRIFERF